jgi:hypothetical protein
MAEESWLGVLDWLEKEHEELYVEYLIVQDDWDVDQWLFELHPDECDEWESRE